MAGAQKLKLTNEWVCLHTHPTKTVRIKSTGKVRMARPRSIDQPINDARCVTLAEGVYTEHVGGPLMLRADSAAEIEFETL